jgi:hypothetical protein
MPTAVRQYSGERETPCTEAAVFLRFGGSTFNRGKQYDRSGRLAAPEFAMPLEAIGER